MNGFKKKILILSANPKNKKQLSLDKETSEIEEGFRRSKLRDHFTITSKWAVCLRDLRRALLDEQPHIVHFCGHGTTEGIQVEDDNGYAVVVPPDALSDLFGLCKEQVECVLLNACYSEIQSEAICRHIPCVIGMNQEISNKIAREFAVGFYDALGAGKSYEDAFRFGKNAIALHNLSQQNIPVLRIRMPLIKNGTDDSMTKDEEIEFVNREKEIAQIQKVFKTSQYQLINAPAEYGKSRLLRRLKDDFSKMPETRCLDCDLSKNNIRTTEELLRALLQQLGGENPEDPSFIYKNIAAQCGNIQTLFLLIDSAEDFKGDSEAKKFLNTGLPKLQESLRILKTQVTLKVICAGRYISHWPELVKLITFVPLNLTPFDFTAIKATIELHDK